MSGMRKKTPWDRILSAPTTSHALELASFYPPTDLSNMRMPLGYEHLSRRARNNARAVRRALGVKVEGLLETGWETWQETDLDRVSLSLNDNNCADSNNDMEEITSTAEEDLLDEAEVEQVSIAKDDKSSTKPVHSLRARSPRKETGGPERLSKRQRTEVLSAKRSASVEPMPTAEEVKHAEKLNHWATTSPHIPPPSDSVRIISQSSSVPSLLQITAPPHAISNVLAAIVTVFTENAGSSFARHVVAVLVIPYVKELKAPAPRDVMQAIVSFFERHWRAILALYVYICDRDVPVNGAVAELLVRIAGVTPVQGAAESFRMICRSPWGEDGIRVVEALLLRCKAEKGIASSLVPALEKNVAGSERSVRFGKLLFTAVRDIPDIASTFRESMESICSRSKVFLSKRALTELRKKSANP